MESDAQKNKNKAVRVELKYCERCGGLWVRECGAGVVYCETCQQTVEELPAPKKKRVQRVTLPVQRRSAVDDYADGGGDLDLEAAGGAA